MGPGARSECLFHSLLPIGRRFTLQEKRLCGAPSVLISNSPVWEIPFCFSYAQTGKQQLDLNAGCWTAVWPSLRMEAQWSMGPNLNDFSSVTLSPLIHCSSYMHRPFPAGPAALKWGKAFTLMLLNPGSIWGLRLVVLVEWILLRPL